MTSERPYTEADRKLVLDAILAYKPRFAADEVLNRLTTRGWVNLSRVSGYEIDGEMHRPDDVQIWMRPEATDG